MDWEPWSALELSGWTQAWIDGFVVFLAVASVVAAFALATALALALRGVDTTVVRRFWCREAGRDVEVQFGSSGPRGWRTVVIACSAFEPATAVTCRRTCVDPSVRASSPPSTRWPGNAVAVIGPPRRR